MDQGIGPKRFRRTGRDPRPVMFDKRPTMPLHNQQITEPKADIFRLARIPFQHGLPIKRGYQLSLGVPMAKKSVLLSLLGAAAGLVLLRNKRSSSFAASRSETHSSSGLEQSRTAADDATRRYLMYVIMPIWSIVGFLDWLWHRQTKIETTSGVKESAMHLLMMAEAGAPILTGLLLEMNAGVLALMAAGWLIHDLTVAWDVSYTASRRPIYPREQHTHSYMQSIPFEIVATLACLYPQQALALIGMGSEKPDFRLRLRRPPIPITHFAAIVACMGLTSGLPHVEELWRCFQAQQKGLAGSEIPECAQELYGSS